MPIIRSRYKKYINERVLIYLRNIDSKKMFDKITNATISDVCTPSNYCTTLVVEIWGTATSMSIKLEGIMDNDNTSSWSTIGYVDSSMENMGSTITKNGVYNFSIDAFSKVRLNATTVSGGELTAFAKAGA